MNNATIIVTKNIKLGHVASLCYYQTIQYVLYKPNRMRPGDKLEHNSLPFVLGYACIQSSRWRIDRLIYY